MAEQDETPEGTETDAALDASAEDDKVLDDLDPDEEEATGVEGGQRMDDGGWGTIRI